MNAVDNRLENIMASLSGGEDIQTAMLWSRDIKTKNSLGLGAHGISIEEPVKR